MTALGEFVGHVVPIAREPRAALMRAALLSGAALAVTPRDFADPRAARARLWTASHASLPVALVRDRTLRRRLREAGLLDGLVQYGGEYRSPRDIRMVTYQDSTVPQAVRAYPWRHLRGLSDRDVKRQVRLQRAAYESAVACCALTHWAAESIVEDFGIARDKVHVVGLGANHVVDGSQVTRDWSQPRFLFVGADWERKNGAGLLRAFAQVRLEIPEARLDLVGGHPERIDQLGVYGHGRLSLGDPADRQTLAELYRSATVFVMPSLHEPSGTVHLEAAAAGIPSIGSHNGGTATCVGDSGVLVDGRSADDLIAAMRALSEPQVAQMLGKRAVDHARLFTWRKVAERLVRALGLPDVDRSGLAEFLPPPRPSYVVR